MTGPRSAVTSPIGPCSTPTALPRRSYADLVDGEVAAVHRHEVMVAVTVHAGQCGPRRPCRRGRPARRLRRAAARGGVVGPPAG